MKIVNLKAENVKRLSAVEITPTGTMTIIGGRNEQGKTSVLDSIEMLLGGKNAQGPMPIRQGAGAMQIDAQLADSETRLSVQRRTTASKDTLIVKDASGTTLNSPQAILDELYNSLTFDPLEFTRMQPKQQSEILMRMLGLDFAPLDGLREDAFENRTEINRQVRDLEGRTLASHPDVPPDAKLIDIEQMTSELQARHAHNLNLKTAVQVIENSRQIEADYQRQIRELEAKLTELKNKISDQITVKLSFGDEQPTEQLAAELSQAGEWNQKVRHNEGQAMLDEAAKDLKRQSDGYSAELQRIDAEKAKQLAEAPKPIEGLSIGENGVTYKGIPFVQCSGEEKLRVSFAMMAAMDPKLKVVLIRDGSLLDEQNLALLSQMAARLGIPAEVMTTPPEKVTATDIMDRLRTARLTAARSYPRNAPCPCGSGMKVKRCCASPQQETQQKRS